MEDSPPRAPDKEGLLTWNSTTKQYSNEKKKKKKRTNKKDLQ